MKDVKLQTVRPVAEPRPGEKPARKEKAAGTSFNDTLKDTVARMNELKAQAEGTLKGGDHTIKEEIDAAREMYDRMMLEKKNLSQLYHRIKTQDES